MNSKLTTERLSRRAIVYVRQSSPGQLLHNQESRLRQYGLVDRARELGFHDVIMIDDDLGRSGDGPSSDQDFSDWWVKFAPGKSGACSASRRPDWRATVATGII